MRRDIDEALHGWPFEPDPNEAMAVREVRARDGRSVLQIRVELGIMQLEVEGRPDGIRPHSFPTFLDYLRHRASSRSSGGGNKPPWAMSAEHCVEADREFVQYYKRRIAWLTLQRYDKAVQDAEHSLALADFVQRHANDPEYVALHERSRGLVLLHKTQATAALSIERNKPEESIDIIRDGIERLIEHQQSIQNDLDDTPNEPFIEQLRAIEREIRKDYAVEKTLKEQLDEAVADEDYELAARLRDQIKAQTRR